MHYIFNLHNTTVYIRIIYKMPLKINLKDTNGMYINVL